MLVYSNTNKLSFYSDQSELQRRMSSCMLIFCSDSLTIYWEIRMSPWLQSSIQINASHASSHSHQQRAAF